MDQFFKPPQALAELKKKALEKFLSEEIDHFQQVDNSTGAFLREFARKKPGGMLLELGTGLGISAAWLLDGMDQTSKLVSVDNWDYHRIPHEFFAADSRLLLHTADALEFLTLQPEASFDLLFADTNAPGAGKFDGLDLALKRIKPGGLYVIDHMRSEGWWPPSHCSKVNALVERLQQHLDFDTNVQLDWGTGLVVATKRAN